MYFLLKCAIFVDLKSSKKEAGYVSFPASVV